MDIKSYPRWVWPITGGLVAVVAGVWAVPSFWGGPAEAAPQEIAFRAKVKSVRNGHSVKLKDGRKLKYAGIRSLYPNEPLFEEAKARNEELVAEKSVRLRFESPPDPEEDRIRGYAFTRQGFDNEILVREGLAYVRSTTAEHRFADKLLEAQKHARRKGIGIWKHRKNSHKASYPADPKYGNFHRPDCPEVAKINPDRLVVFKSAREALAGGFAPCSHCMP